MALAKGGDESVAPTFFFDSKFGLVTYKSEIVASNETSTSVAYGFGVYAGRDRDIGFFLNNESTTVAFELNGASLTSTWRDLIIRYRLGPTYLGLVVNDSTFVIARPDPESTDAEPPSENFVDLSGSGYGVNLGLQIPMGKRGSHAYLDIISVSSLTVKEAIVKNSSDTIVNGTREAATLASRTDMDLGGAIDLTKDMIDAIVGYKTRTYTMTVDGTSYTDTTSSTYLGLKFSWIF